MLCPLPAETTLQHRFNWCMLRLHLFSLPIIHAVLICYLYAFHWRYWFLSSKWKLQLLFFILYVHGRNMKFPDLGFLSFTSLVSNPRWWKQTNSKWPLLLSWWNPSLGLQETPYAQCNMPLKIISFLAPDYNIQKPRCYYSLSPDRDKNYNPCA